MQTITDYFGRHWRGGFSLAYSFWVNCFLIAWTGGSVPLEFCNLITHYTGPAAVLGAIVTGAAAIALWVWGIIGTWAGCRNSRSDIAKLMTRILLVLYSVVTAIVALSFVAIAAWMIFTGKPVPRNGTTIQGNGVLRFSGIINQYMIGDFAAKLSSASGLRIVELNSPGGDQATAKTMATLIAGHQLDTQVVHQCKGYCVVAFMAGRKRSLGDGGRLVFIGNPAAATPPAHGFMPQVPDTASLVAAGIPADFVARIVANSNGLGWAPSAAMLKTAGIFLTAP